MPHKILYKVLWKIDGYRNDMRFSKLFWEELEDAFNKAMGDNYMSERYFDGESFSQYSFTLDDDKVHFNYGAKHNVRLAD